MDSPDLKMPPTGSPVRPKNAQPWRRLLQASLAIVAVSAGSASAQTDRNAQEAHTQWRKLTQAEVNCVDQALHGHHSNLWDLIQQGVRPSDSSVAKIRAACRGKLDTSHSSTPITTNRQTSQAQTARAIDTSLARASDAGANRPAIPIAATGRAPRDMPAPEGRVTERKATPDYAVEKMTADEPAVRKSFAEQEEKVVVAARTTANGDVVQVASIDKTEPAKAVTEGETAPKKTTAVAAMMSADVDTETRLSFVCGLLSGVATAGALALVFFARQRQRSAQAAAVTAAEVESIRGGSPCQFDRLARAVLDEQNRLNQSTLKRDRATPGAEPGAFVHG